MLGKCRALHSKVSRERRVMSGEKGKGLGHSRKQTGLGCPHNKDNRIIGKQMPSFCVQSINVMEDCGKHGWNSILKD